MTCSRCYYFVESHNSDYGRCLVFCRQANAWSDDDNGCEFALGGRPEPYSQPAPQPAPKPEPEKKPAPQPWKKPVFADFADCANCESAARKKIEEQEATIATLCAERDATRSECDRLRAELAVARADLSALRARLSRIRDEAVKP